MEKSLFAAKIPAGRVRPEVGQKRASRSFCVSGENPVIVVHFILMEMVTVKRMSGGAEPNVSCLFEPETEARFIADLHESG